MVARNVEIDVLEIVLAGTTDGDHAGVRFRGGTGPAPAVSFGGTGVTVLYADGSLKPSALAVSGLYMVELEWFSTAASGATKKYMIVNIYKVAEAAS